MNDSTTKHGLDVPDVITTGLSFQEQLTLSSDQRM